MSDDDLIRRGDAIAACAVGPSDEWARATKSGYMQAATDCTFNVLRIPAAVSRAQRAALAASQPADPVTNDSCFQPVRVKHVKRGSTYRVIGAGKVQTGTPLHDYDEVVIYQDEADGRLWVRPTAEFGDGRFEPVEPADMRCAECDCTDGNCTWIKTEPVTVLDAPAEDAVAKGETAGQTLDRLGMDGAKWAAEFRTTALRHGYSDMDEGWLIGWFCNAIMAGHDRAQSPDAGKMAAPVTPAEARAQVQALVDAGERMTGPLWRLILADENCIKNPCDLPTCECRQKFDRIAGPWFAALAALKDAPK